MNFDRDDGSGRGKMWLVGLICGALVLIALALVETKVQNLSSQVSELESQVSSLSDSVSELRTQLENYDAADSDRTASDTADAEKSDGELSGNESDESDGSGADIENSEADTDDSGADADDSADASADEASGEASDGSSAITSAADVKSLDDIKALFGDLYPEEYDLSADIDSDYEDWVTGEGDDWTYEYGEFWDEAHGVWDDVDVDDWDEEDWEEYVSHNSENPISDIRLTYGEPDPEKQVVPVLLEIKLYDVAIDRDSSAVINGQEIRLFAAGSGRMVGAWDLGLTDSIDSIICQIPDTGNRTQETEVDMDILSQGSWYCSWSDYILGNCSTDFGYSVMDFLLWHSVSVDGESLTLTGVEADAGKNEPSVQIRTNAGGANGQDISLTCDDAEFCDDGTEYVYYELYTGSPFKYDMGKETTEVDFYIVFNGKSGITYRLYNYEITYADGCSNETGYTDLKMYYGGEEIS